MTFNGSIVYTLYHGTCVQYKMDLNHIYGGEYLYYDWGKRFCIPSWKSIFMFAFFPGHGVQLSTIDPGTPSLSFNQETPTDREIPQELQELIIQEVNVIKLFPEILIPAQTSSYRRSSSMTVSFHKSSFSSHTSFSKASSSQI